MSHVSIPSPPFLPTFFSASEGVPAVPVKGKEHFEGCVVVEDAGGRPTNVPIYLSDCAAKRVFCVERRGISVEPSDAVLPSGN